MQCRGWRVVLMGLVIGFAGLVGGCGGQPSGDQVQVDQEKVDGHIKGMQDFMKKQAQGKK